MSEYKCSECGSLELAVNSNIWVNPNTWEIGDHEVPDADRKDICVCNNCGWEGELRSFENE